MEEKKKVLRALPFFFIGFADNANGDLFTNSCFCNSLFFFSRTFDASHRRKKNAMATLLLKIIERAQFNCEAPQATTKQTLQIDVQLAALFLRVELH